MTIEYKDSKRIVKLSTDTVETITLDEDFSSDNFNDTGTKIGVANNTLEWDGAQNGSVNGSTIDLTSIDTKAVFRAKLRINTLTAPSSASSFILIGFSDSDHTTAGDSSQDGIGLIIQNDADVANTFRAMHVDGAPFSPNAGTVFATVPATATDYFIEVVLDVNTWYVRIYSDSSYSTLTEEETGSLTATGLRYFGIKMRSSASVGGTFDGYIDDFKFYNGVASVSSKPTNIQDNSLLIEKDTARRYWFDAESSNTVTFQDDFSSDNWTDQDSAEIGVGTNQLDFNADRDGSNNASSVDIGTTLSDSKWIVDIDYQILTVGTTGNGENLTYFAISSTDSATANNSNADRIGVANAWFSTYRRVEPFNSNGAVIPATGSRDNILSTITSVVGTYYLRIQRNSSTEYKVSYYPTSARTGTPTDSYTNSSISGITGLKYIVVGNEATSHASATTAVTGKITSVKVYNGVTSTTEPAIWTKQNPELPTVSGLYVHYDATDVNSITKDSNNRISQWNDKSGGERHLTQATSGNQPLWISSDEAGNPVIDFSDDRYMSDTWTAQSLPNTIFIVARLPVATASRTNIISGSGGNAQSVFGDGSNTWKYASGTAQGGTKTGIEDTWQYIYALYGDDYTFEIGGELISGANCGTDTWTGMEVGASSGIQFGNMKIGEIIGYNVAVKGDDKTAIINYLKEKWERT